jgi:hypothetical protein
MLKLIARYVPKWTWDGYSKQIQDEHKKIASESKARLSKGAPGIFHEAE